MLWYLEILLFSFVVPYILRSYQNRIAFKASCQSLVLSLVWLGIQLSTQQRPSNNIILGGWLFIYSFGTLVLLFGRIGHQEKL